MQRVCIPAVAGATLGCRRATLTSIVASCHLAMHIGALRNAGFETAVLVDGLVSCAPWSSIVVHISGLKADVSLSSPYRFLHRPMVGLD